MGDTELGVVSEERDLGVIVSKDLKVNKQCTKAANKGNQVLGMISRSFENKNKDIMLQLYKSLVRPHLDFCIQSWRPYLAKDIALLEKVQKRATRMIKECKNMRYNERLKTLKLTTLETRRMRADLIEVFKIIKGLEGLSEETFFERSGSITRGHSLKLNKARFRLDVAKYSFSNRTCNDWNALPEEIIQANTVNEFKGKVDRYLRDRRGLI